jgi:DNA-binding NtrC family response regulator
MNSPALGQPSERCVLVVDDELSIVNAIRRELSTPPLGRYRYAVEGFVDPAAALARAREKEFDVVITDYQMPGMDGFEFLKQLYSIQPECSRIVLSGQAEMAALIKLINETHIFRFIPKPWSSYFLKSAVSQAVDFHQTIRKNRRLAKALRDQGVDLPDPDTEITEHILVVDDELSVAHAIVRELSQQSGLDDVFSAIDVEANSHASPLSSNRISVRSTESPIHALKMADDVVFSCVIADYLMPGMDGVQFLYEFAEKQPDSVRIMLSGAASLDNIVSALDLGHIDTFIAKPWEGYDLRAAVAEGLSRRRLNMENAILANYAKARSISLDDD